MSKQLDTFLRSSFIGYQYMSGVYIYLIPGRIDLSAIISMMLFTAILMRLEIGLKIKVNHMKREKLRIPDTGFAKR